jgi:hypothetical protein
MLIRSSLPHISPKYMAALAVFFQHSISAGMGNYGLKNLDEISTLFIGAYNSFIALKTASQYFGRVYIRSQTERISPAKA